MTCVVPEYAIYLLSTALAQFLAFVVLYAQKQKMCFKHVGV